MIGAIHNKLNAFSDGTKLSNNQFITKKLIMVSDMVFKLFCSVHIIVVSVFPHNNVRLGNHILDVYDLLDVFVWIYMIRIWSHNLTLSNSD